MRRGFILLLAAGLLGGASAAAAKRRNMLFFIAECALPSLLRSMAIALMVLSVRSDLRPQLNKAYGQKFMHTPAFDKFADEALTFDYTCQPFPSPFPALSPPTRELQRVAVQTATC